MPDMTHGLNEGPHGAHRFAADVHGQNFYAIDRQFQDDKPRSVGRISLSNAAISSSLGFSTASVFAS